MKNKTSFFKKPWFFWVMLILFPPIGIVLTWTVHKNMTLNKKVLFTVVALLWFLFVIAAGNGSSEERAESKENSEISQGYDQDDSYESNEQSESETSLKQEESAESYSPDSESSAYDPEITILSFPQKARRNSDVTVKIQGAPNTRYEIIVYYKSGPAKADGLEDKTSDDSGYVTWTWRIGGKTSPGNYKIIIYGDGKKKEIDYEIVVD